MSMKNRIKGLPEYIKNTIRIIVYATLFLIMYSVIKYYYGGSLIVSIIVAFEYILFYWWNRYVDKEDRRIKEELRK